MSTPVELSGLDLVAEPSNLTRVRHWTEEIYRAANPGGSDEGMHALVLAVHEAVRNVIEHAYEGATGILAMRAERAGNAVVVRVIHEGKPFDEPCAGPVFDGTHDSGFGVYLMTQAADRIAYRTGQDGRQCVELTKELKRPRSLARFAGAKERT